jgi:integrase
VVSRRSAPGLVRRKNKDGSHRHYWEATRRAKSLGFEPAIVPLHETSDGEIASRCAILQAEMLEFIAQRESIAGMPLRRVTIAMLFREYRECAESPFQAVKWNTRRTYSQMLDTIERACGDVLLENIKLATLKKWYDDARYPEGKGADKPDRVRTAHGVISMIRRTIDFGVAAEIAGCDRIDRILSKVSFEAPKPRTAFMGVADVEKLLAAAEEAGRPSLGLGTAIQYECALRQRDVIGEWEPIDDDGPSSSLVLRGRQWVNGLTWSDISDDWVMTKTTTKTGAIVSFDLRLCPLAFRLLSAVPAEKRFGPLIVDETAGRPYAEHAYHREWRKVANAAKIPPGVWNMDARAGAATEADDAGASIEGVRRAMGHQDPKTTARYIRGPGLEQSRRVATLRVAHRNKTK